MLSPLFEGFQNTCIFSHFQITDSVPYLTTEKHHHKVYPNYAIFCCCFLISFQWNFVSVYKKTSNTKFHDFCYFSPKEKIVCILKTSVRCSTFFTMAHRMKLLCKAGCRAGYYMLQTPAQTPAAVPQHMSFPAVATGTQIWTLCSLLFLISRRCYRARANSSFLPFSFHSTALSRILGLESENAWGGNGPWWSSSSEPHCYGQDHLPLDQATQGTI